MSDKFHHCSRFRKPRPIRPDGPGRFPDDIDDPNYTRWSASYEGLDGAYPHPEVYAATKEKAIERAVEAFRGLFAYADVDPTFELLVKLPPRHAFDPSKVIVTDIGLPLWKVENLEVKPMPMPDLSAIYNMDFKILDGGDEDA